MPVVEWGGTEIKMQSLKNYRRIVDLILKKCLTFFVCMDIICANKKME